MMSTSPSTFTEDGSECARQLEKRLLRDVALDVMQTYEGGAAAVETAGPGDAADRTAAEYNHLNFLALPECNGDDSSIDDAEGLESRRLDRVRVQMCNAAARDSAAAAPQLRPPPWRFSWDRSTTGEP